MCGLTASLGVLVFEMIICTMEPHLLVVIARTKLDLTSNKNNYF